MHAAVARSRSGSQKTKNTTLPKRFWHSRCRTSARHCGVKNIRWSQPAQYQRSIRKAENNAKQTIVFVNLNAELHNTNAILGSVALLGAGSQSQKLQNCSGHFKMSSSLKDLQCIAVCAEVECSETRSIMPLSHRIGRLQNHHIPSAN